MERIRAGDYVVLVPESGGGHTSVVQVTKNGSVRMGKKHWKLKHLIGCRFGSRFEGGGKEGVLIEKRLEIQKSDGEDKDVGGDAKKDGDKGELNTSRIEDMKARASFVESGDLEPRDNRSLHDDNTAQKLGQSAINGMKLNKKLSGQDIVDALVKNSSTYQTKTAFSQEKYRRKKEQKYVTLLTAYRPTIHSVASALFTKYQGQQYNRIAGLRIDSLSLLLNGANIGEGSKCLVVDGSGGLLTASALARVGYMADSLICVGYCGSTSPNLEITKMFNFEVDHYQRVCRASFRELDMEQTTLNSTYSDPNAAEKDHNMDQETLRKTFKPKSIRRMSQNDLDNINGSGFSCLIVADPKLDPSSVYMTCSRFLAASASIAFFSQSLQPLAELMAEMTTTSKDSEDGKTDAVNVQLYEPWMREYQVLPMRTHPNMSMSATGGYVLTATYVGQGINGKRENVLKRDLAKDSANDIVDGNEEETLQNKRLKGDDNQECRVKDDLDRTGKAIDASTEAAAHVLYTKEEDLISIVPE